MTQQRVAKLLQLAAQSNLDAVAIMPGPNIQYFSGLHFHLSERPTLAIFPVAGPPALICPAFEATKTQRSPIVGCDAEVIILTGHASMDIALNCMQYGAYDFLLKPCDVEEISLKISQAYDHLEKEKIN